MSQAPIETDHDDVLEIDALTPIRKRIRIKHKAAPEGEIFEMAARGDLGAVEVVEFGKKCVEMDDLFNRKKKSESQRKRYTKLLNELAATLIPRASATTIQSIDPFDKRLLALDFLTRLSDSVQRTAPALMSSESPSAS